MKKLVHIAIALSVFQFAGCASVAKLATMAGQESGFISSSQALSINRSAAAVEKTFEDITPEQEYYIGRSVMATVFLQYKPFDKKEFNRYLNQLGQTLAQASGRPETYSGYHFLMVDSDEINAFAAPGGLIVVTRGLVALCTLESDLAAVLAHEIGHVEKQHGLKSIKKGRLTGAFNIMAAEGTKTLAGENLARVTEGFTNSIGDITHTLVTSGYSRAYEFEADRSAIAILKRVGYDSHSFVKVLTRIKERTGALKTRGFGKTHPDPQARIKEAITLIGPGTGSVESVSATTRFEKAVKTL